MLQKSSLWLVESVFFRFPTTEQTLKDISKAIHLAHTSVKKNLQLLVKRGLVQRKEERKGKRRFPIYQANRSNKLFTQYKRAYNLQALLESGVIAYIEERLLPKSVVVFGSYQRGEDTEGSDIDLFVESKKEDLELTSFEKKLARKIELHFKEQFTSYPRELKNNIINGVVLHGFLEGYL
ncbi:MAG: nucleotidyltransferase domain-containing protein [Nanoarchaeota archaeon]